MIFSADAQEQNIYPVPVLAFKFNIRAFHQVLDLADNRQVVKPVGWFVAGGSVKGENYVNRQKKN